LAWPSNSPVGIIALWVTTRENAKLFKALSHKPHSVANVVGGYRDSGDGFTTACPGEAVRGQVWLP
jgi:hypothetical protein